MKHKELTSALLVATFILLLSLGCNRDRVTWDGEVTTTVDHNFADSEFNSIRNMVDTEGTSDSSIYGKVTGTQGIFCPGSVATVSILSSNSASLTIDFGTGSNCLDGRLRTGKIHATFTGKWRDPGSNVVITPEDYTVAGYAFDFTATVTVNPLDGNGHRNWTTVVNDAILIHPSNGTIRWNGTRTTTWVQGEGSLDPNTYVYEVTGSANGTARNGLTFSASTLEPLRVELSCRWIVDGVWSITPQGRETRSIDYGGTGCDDQAVLSVGDFTTSITLP